MLTSTASVHIGGHSPDATEDSLLQAASLLYEGGLYLIQGKSPSPLDSVLPGAYWEDTEVAENWVHDNARTLVDLGLYFRAHQAAVADTPAFTAYHVPRAGYAELRQDADKLDITELTPFAVAAAIAGTYSRGDLVKRLNRLIDIREAVTLRAHGREFDKLPYPAHPAY